MKADKLPFDFVHNGKKEKVNFENGKLLIGAQSYILEGKKGITVAVTGVKISGSDVQFEHIGGPTQKPKSLIAQNLPELLKLNTNLSKEVTSDGSSLVIRRTA